MAITVLFKKTTASWVPWLNFSGPFLDEKSDFYIASFESFRIVAKIDDFSKKNLRATIFKVEDYSFGF